MIENVEFVSAACGIRLDAALLMRYPSVPRAFVREACGAGDVLVDGRRAPKGMKLKGGERITVLHLDEAADNRPAPDPSVRPRIIFEDEALLAFDKPAGMPVQPLDRREKGALMNGVAARWPECVGAGDDPLMAGALHRIDTGTSGLVMVARTGDAFANMRAQFSAGKVRKTYLAVVEGAVAVGCTLENDLAHMPGIDFCKMADAARLGASAGRAMHAVTSFRPLCTARDGGEERTLLEVVIYTGVTHQIRAQLAIAGMHILNDRLYGAFAVEGMEGHMLHSFSASFLHPVSGERCEIRTEAPEWALVPAFRECVQDFINRPAGTTEG